jgi:hypothetical protein
VLKINNNVVQTKNLVLAAGESQDVAFTVTQNQTGSYSIEVNGQTGTMTVKEAASKTPFLFQNWWILLVVVAAVAVGTVVIISSTRKGTSGGKR